MHMQMPAYPSLDVEVVASRCCYHGGWKPKSHCGVDCAKRYLSVDCFGLLRGASTLEGPEKRADVAGNRAAGAVVALYQAVMALVTVMRSTASITVACWL